ncbi:hypothetical protein [Tellurirhabdus bombi]|uniref:hypothetical protein n=1 Tax=Tellurirhabdus bombi TaxID=2907205 RepID=UPI001F42A2D3|nr:hypothetical protein [Tellurirhabdus bombi]
MKSNLKFSASTLLLLAGILFAACDSNKVTPTTETLDPVVVSATKSARLKHDVNLKVTKIEDNRCPANAICIQAGSANVFFTLEANNETKSSELCLGACSPTSKVSDKALVQVGGTEYEVLLKEVTPYPGTSPEPREREATIQVTARK